MVVKKYIILNWLHESIVIFFVPRLKEVEEKEDNEQVDIK